LLTPIYNGPDPEDEPPPTSLVLAAVAMLVLTAILFLATRCSP